MSRRRPHPSFLLNWLSVDRKSLLPLYSQIGDQLRRVIVDGNLAPGDYLPSSRDLASELGISRNTTLQAYDQLIAEGFLESRPGSGTLVAISLADNPVGTRKKTRSLFNDVPARADVHDLERSEDEPAGVSFQPGIPSFDSFPRLLWGRLLKRHAIRADQFMLDYAHTGGYAPLRLELAKYLNVSRGVACEPGQIIVTTSTRAAIDTVARVLWPAGASVAVEDPGYLTAKRLLIMAGYRLQNVPVDANGVRVEEMLSAREPPVGAYLTPTHQWPTGATLSAVRRIRLLEWAERTGAWLLEDDYDSEFRFDGPPVATLQSSGSSRVIYIGTFSKTLAPSIRTSYFVVPPDLAGRFELEVYRHGVEPALHVQAALADLIAEGHFTRHIRRMRRLYAHRRALLVGALEITFGDGLRLECPAGGLQLIAWLPEHVAASRIARAAAEADLVARPMSVYQPHGSAPNALHLGFAAVPDDDILPQVRRLHDAVGHVF